MIWYERLARGGRVPLVILAVMLVVASLGCAGGRAPTTQVTGEPPVGRGLSAPPPSAPTTNHQDLPAVAGPTTTLDQALSDLDALPTPEGVEEALFSELKEALREALAQRVGRGFIPAENAAGLKSSPTQTIKLVSRPPTGEPNRVDDLELTDNGDGTYTLTWSYVNMGDYNQDGIVDVKDITPLAVHLNEPADETNEWIDGNGDSVINIADITPLAARFLVNVASYRVEVGPSLEGTYTELGSVGFGQGVLPPEGGRMEFSYLLGDSPAIGYYRVVPVDADGIAGDAGAPLHLAPPQVLSVSPLGGVAGTEATFTAEVSGIAPLTYAWDFGGGATPNTSDDGSPTVTLSVEGSYSASLTVSNAMGDTTFPFTLTVGAAPLRPSVDWVMPTQGFSGDEVQFTAEVSGDLPIYYSWDFGGGAIPNTSTDYRPTVTLRGAGEYEARLELTSPYGSSVYRFSLRVFNWTFQEVGMMGDTSPSLAFDPEGRPAIAVSNVISRNADYLYLSTGVAPPQWSRWPITGASAGSRYFYPSLRFDHTSNPLVSFVEAGPGGLQVALMWWEEPDTPSWWTGTSPPNMQDELPSSSLSLDTSGTPYIVYAGTFFDNFEVAIMSQEEEWSIIPGIDSWQGTDAHSSIALDSGGNPVVAYPNVEGLKVARWDGEQWNRQVVVEGVTPRLGERSLAMDASDNIFIAYRDESAGLIKLARNDGGDWDIQPVAACGELSTSRPALALDADGNPLIGFAYASDYTTPRRAVKIAWWSGDSWFVEPVDFLDAGERTPVGFNGDGIPAVAYASPNGIRYAVRRAPLGSD